MTSGTSGSDSSHARSRRWGRSQPKLVDALADREHKSYIDLAGPSGAGRTTLIEDLVAWAVVRDRGLRVMLGSETSLRAQELLRWLKNRFESTVRFYNEDTEEFAQGILAEDFGRLKPQGASGDSVLWRVDRIVVPQFTGLDLFQKEPTVQVGSRDSTITGARIDLAVWDDLVLWA